MLSSQNFPNIVRVTLVDSQKLEDFRTWDINCELRLDLFLIIFDVNANALMVFHSLPLLV